jgi:peptide chain release factor 1
MEFAPAIVEKLREKAARHAELTEQLASPETAADPRRYPVLLKERGALEDAAAMAARLEELQSRRADDEAVLADADSDAELLELARTDLEALEDEERAFDEEVRHALVADEDDLRTKLIVEVRAGTGGDEATLFAADLYRIYLRYIDAQGWRSELLHAQPTEVGGFKELTFAVSGDGCWRQLRYESGGHRVQRVPETEAQGRIHTSAATVAVLPEAEDVELELRDEDLRIDTMRAGGAGGQHVNKTESAVRITHMPSGMMVTCMDEKSQHKNKARALRILRSRLLEAEQERVHAERAAWRRSQVGTGDRNARVRTYNWPQSRVTDHRLNMNFSLESVLNGKLGPLLEALEAADREERIRNL